MNVISAKLIGCHSPTHPMICIHIIKLDIVILATINVYVGCLVSGFGNSFCLFTNPFKAHSVAFKSVG